MHASTSVAGRKRPKRSAVALDEPMLAFAGELIAVSSAFGSDELVEGPE